MKISIFIFTFILTSFSIHAENISELIEKHFNSNESKKLARLVNDFDKHIASNYSKSGDLVLAWQSFFRALATIETTSEIKEKIKLSNEAQDKMLKKVGKETLLKIWNIEQPSSGNGNKYIELKSLKYKSNYIEFLEDLVKNNELIRNYRNDIEMAGDISPTAVANLIYHQARLDISDADIRLFLTVHYLSLNKEALKR